MKSTMRHGFSGAFALRLIATAALIIGAAWAASTTAQSADETGARIESALAALEKWVETERVISKEKRDFEISKDMLRERIQLVQSEIRSLREKIAEAETSIEEIDAKREEMAKTNEMLKQASSSLAGILASMEDRTLALLKQVPQPVSERLKPLSQRIPETAEETKQTLSARFQNIVGILNEINKSALEISMTSEVRELPDGSAAEVTALYLGIGQSFYVGSNGQIAGIGRPGDEGWEWTPHNGAAPAISTAVSILNNEQAASFVTAPVMLR